MAHINKHKTIVNICLFVYLLAQPITYIGVLCLCPEQTVFQENASQPAEDACTSSPFLLRSNCKHFHSCSLYFFQLKVNSKVFQSCDSSYNINGSRRIRGVGYHGKVTNDENNDRCPSDSYLFTKHIHHSSVCLTTEGIEKTYYCCLYTSNRQ